MNIEELLTSRGISFKQKGKDLVTVCLNPEHDSDSPNLYIDREQGMYHCYSCGFRGRSIYQLLGVDAPMVSPQIQQFKRKLQDLSIFSVGIQLPESRELFSSDFRNIAQSTYQQLEAFTHSDWEGRICFPIQDIVTGNICAVIQRTMYTDVKPKYIAYPTGVKIPFYPAVQEDGVTVLVEGIFDVANLREHGLQNATQIFGVSTVTHHTIDQKQLPLVAAYTKKVVILLDNDEAGNTAAKQLAKLLSKYFRVHIQNSLLPQGSDPGSLSSDEVKYLKKYINEIDWL